MVQNFKSNKPGLVALHVNFGNNPHTSDKIAFDKIERVFFLSKLFLKFYTAENSYYGFLLVGGSHS